MGTEDLLSRIADGLEGNLAKDLERVKCETDLVYLCEHGLNYNDMDKCHQDLSDWIGERWIDGINKRQFFLLLMPRGHLKSSVFTIGKSIQEIIKQPNVRILIANAVWENARTFLKSINEQLKKPYFVENFGAGFDRETQEEITVSARSMKELKEPTVRTTGVEKAQASQHYDIIICDDLVVRENVTTKEQIEKVTLFYKDLLSLLEPNGKMVVIGTRWHDNDLYGQIQDPKTKLGSEFVVYKSKALCKGEIRVKELEDGRRQAYATEGAEPIFPKKFSVETLCGLYDELGQYEFYSQYFNETVDPEHAKFKRSWLKEYNEKDIEGIPLNHTIVLDPAISEEKHGDYSAFTVVGVAPDGKWYVRLAEAIQTNDPDRLIKRLFVLNEIYKPLKVGIEVVQFQKTLAFYIRKYMQEHNRFIPLEELKTDTSVNKEMRIMGLQPFFEMGNIRIKSDMDDLVEQLTRFPRSKHDDLIDSLAYHLQIAKYKPNIRVKSKKTRPTFDEIRRWAIGMERKRKQMGDLPFIHSEYTYPGRIIVK